MLSNKKNQGSSYDISFKLGSSLDKKAQASEGIVWIIATIVIIVTLFLFIYASSLLGKLKDVGVSLKTFGEDSQDIPESSINLKTLLAFELNDKNKDKIKEWVNENG